MFRSFMYSRIRHLLYCQDELALLQKRLMNQDDEDNSIDDTKILLKSRKRYEHRNNNLSQDAVIEKIGSKLKEYGERC